MRVKTSKKMITVQVRCLTCGTVQTKVLEVIGGSYDTIDKWTILCIKCEMLQLAVIVDGKFVFR